MGYLKHTDRYDYKQYTRTRYRTREENLHLHWEGVSGVFAASPLSCAFFCRFGGFFCFFCRSFFVDYISKAFGLVSQLLLSLTGFRFDLLPIWFSLPCISLRIVAAYYFILSLLTLYLLYYPRLYFCWHLHPCGIFSYMHGIGVRGFRFWHLLYIQILFSFSYLHRHFCISILPWRRSDGE